MSLQGSENNENLVQDIEDLRKLQVNPLEALSNEVSNIQGEIENLCASQSPR